MTVVMVAYLVVAVGVTLWFLFPPERAYGTDLPEAMASGAVWPLLVLSLIAFALVCWACPEEKVSQDASLGEPDAQGPARRRSGAHDSVDDVLVAVLP